MKTQKTVLYFVPVEAEYFSKWEYYQVDKDMLSMRFSNVIVCYEFWGFLRAILFSRVDLVYCWWWHQSVVCVLLSRLLKKPVYVTGAVHMYDESGSPDFFSKSVLYRVACRVSWLFASRNLFISKSQYRQICSHEKVNNPSVLKSTLTSSYDPSKFLGRIFNKTVSEKVRLTTIVWMTKDQLKRKSVYETLDAVSILVNKGFTNFEWIIAGGAESGNEELSEKIRELNLEDYVEVQLNLSNDQKQSLYENSDLYVQPSYYEGFGNAVLEAMSFGMPAVVSRNTAQAEVVGKAGLIVEEIDGHSISEVLSEYLNLTVQGRLDMRELVKQTVLDRHLFSYRADQFSDICDTDLS